MGTPSQVTVAELHELMQTGTVGVDYIVVDVRRTDITDDAGAIHSVLPCAINLPAQTFKQTLPASGALLSRVGKVVFHCASSRGRGPRCAQWYQEYLDRLPEHASRSCVLVGGIKAWVEAYPDVVVGCEG